MAVIKTIMNNLIVHHTDISEAVTKLTGIGPALVTIIVRVPMFGAEGYEWVIQSSDEPVRAYIQPQLHKLLP